MGVENPKYISVHIPKTGGTSLREAFIEAFSAENTYFFYPSMGGVYRSDIQQEQIVSFNPNNQGLKDLIVNTKIGNRLYQKIYRRIISQTKPKMTLPEGGSVLHGHFSPSRVEVNDGFLITVLREPLERTKSHYKWMINAKKQNIESPATHWFDPNMSFEEFAQNERMLNFQTKWVEDNWGIFHTIGITNNLDKYFAQIAPSGSNVAVKRLNCSDPRIVIETSDVFANKFRQINKNDYAIYKETLNRSHR